jgi:hypothetical protein
MAVHTDCPGAHYSGIAVETDDSGTNFEIGLDAFDTEHLDMASDTPFVHLYSVAVVSNGSQRSPQAERSLLASFAGFQLVLRKYHYAIAFVQQTAKMVARNTLVDYECPSQPNVNN